MFPGLGVDEKRSRTLDLVRQIASTDKPMKNSGLYDRWTVATTITALLKKTSRPQTIWSLLLGPHPADENALISELQEFERLYVDGEGQNL